MLTIFFSFVFVRWLIVEKVHVLHICVIINQTESLIRWFVFYQTIAVFVLSFTHMASAPETLDPYINASKTVLKQGETLNINCTVHGVELVYFSWDFPHEDVSGLNSLFSLFSRALSAPVRSSACWNELKMCGHTFMRNTCLLRDQSKPMEKEVKSFIKTPEQRLQF